MDSHKGGSHDIWNRLSVYSLIAIAAASFWSTAAVEIASACAVFGSALRLRNSREAIHQHLLLLVLWAAYLIAWITSVFASPYKTEGFHSLLLFWHALLFPAILFTALTRRDITLVTTAMLSSASVAAAAAIIHGLMGGTGLIAPQFVGVTTFANLAVLAVLVGLAVLLAHDLEDRTFSQPIFIAVGLAPVAISVFWSALKGPVIALVGGSLSLVSLLRPRALIWWVCGLLLLFLSSPTVLLLKMEWLVSGGHLDRYALWRAGCSLLPELPLAGYGPGSFVRLLPAEASAAFTGKTPSTWHNDYLQTVLESGWQAGILYAAFLAVTGGRLLFQSHIRKRFSGTLTVLLVCFIFFSTIGSVLGSSILSVVWWCTLGLIVQLSQKDTPS